LRVPAIGVSSELEWARNELRWDYVLDLPDLSVLRRCWPGFEDLSTTHGVRVNGVEIGGARPVVIAGPCAVESFEHTLAVAKAVTAAGVRLMRGGAYKPRTNPHGFSGLGREGLRILTEVRSRTGVGIVTEVLDTRRVEDVAAVADVIQIGSRSMQNFPLLKEVGRTGKPVLLKRAFSGTLEEWLCAAEYVALEGTRDIILCERGVRGAAHWAYSRNLLDLTVIEPLRTVTPLPIIIDPSHATGQASMVPSMSYAALAAGAHGLLIEAMADSTEREALRCDACQAIRPKVLSEIVDRAGGMVVPPVYGPNGAA